jgi:hypothetical protein
MNRTTTQIQTRTVYRLMYQCIANGCLISDPARRGPDCASPVLAKMARLMPCTSEQVVLVQVDCRLGGDGVWHAANETVMEVL